MESTLRAVFIGPKGLRAGWRLMIYLGVLVVIGFGAVLAVLVVMRLVAPGVSMTQVSVRPGLFALSEGLTAAAALIAALPMTLIERYSTVAKRSFGQYGLPVRRAFGKAFWLGGASGLVAITLLLLLIAACGGFTFGQLQLHGLAIVKYAVVWGGVFTLVGISEEFLFRGYTLVTLADGVRFWPAAIVLSLGFGALHLSNQGESWVGALSAAAIAIFFCLTFRRTGTLWYAVGFHAAWDWGESFLYSVPDSGIVVQGHLLNSSFHGATWLTGGAVGPEGSVFVFVVIAAAWFVFDRRHRASAEISTQSRISTQ